MKRTSSGGSAMASGATFQFRVGAWLAVRVLMGSKASPPWALPSTVTFSSVLCETPHSVDDLLVTTSEGGSCLLQVKHRVDLSADPRSDLASFAEQCVRQYLEGERGVASPPLQGRSLEPRTDRLVLVVGRGTADSVKETLARALDGARELLPEQPFEEANPGSQERKRALRILVEHVRSAWQSMQGTPVSESDLRKLLSLSYIQALEVDPGEREEREAKDSLRLLLLDRAQADAAWSMLVEAFGKAAAHRTGMDGARLRALLEDAGLNIRPEGGVESGGGGPLAKRARVLRAPAPPSVFVGRDEELRQLEAEFEKTHIVFIQGLGGLGKSSLAARFVKTSAHRFPEGVLWLKANALPPPMALARAIEGLGGSAVDADNTEVNRSIYLELVTGKQLLVVLDNAEQLEQLTLLLPEPGASGPKVLVTTRDAGLARRIGEQSTSTIPLAVLGLAQCFELMQVIAGSERVDAERVEALSLLRSLGGHTLAVKIVSLLLADNPALNICQLAEDISCRIEQLATDTTEEPQNSSLIACLDVSFHRLSADLQQAFLRLAAFGEDSFDLDAARAVTEVESPGLLTTRLCRLSLLESEASGRWRLHPVVASYAAYRAGDELDWSMLRHAGHYQLQVPSLLEKLQASPDALESVLAEIPHLLMAHHTYAALLAMELNRSIQSALGEDKLPQCGIAGSVLFMSHALIEIRQAVWLPPLPECFEAAVVAARCFPDLQAEVFFGIKLGDAYLVQGRFDEAVGWYKASVEIGRKLAIPPGVLAMSLNNLSAALYQKGELDQALAVAREALPLYEAAGEDGALGVAMSLSNMGNSLLDQGRLEEATSVFERAVAHSPLEDSGTPTRIANLARVLMARGEVQAGLEKFRLALKVLQELPLNRRPEETANLFHNYARALAQAGEETEARKWHVEAWTLAMLTQGPHHPDTRLYARYMGAAGDSRP